MPDTTKKVRRVDLGGQVYTYGGRHWGPGVVNITEGENFTETAESVDLTADALIAARERLKDTQRAPLTERFGGTTPTSAN